MTEETPANDARFVYSVTHHEDGRVTLCLFGAVNGLPAGVDAGIVTSVDLSAELAASLSEELKKPTSPAPRR